MDIPKLMKVLELSADEDWRKITSGPVNEAEIVIQAGRVLKNRYGVALDPYVKIPEVLSFQMTETLEENRILKEYIKWCESNGPANLGQRVSYAEWIERKGYDIGAPASTKPSPGSDDGLTDSINKSFDDMTAAIASMRKTIDARMEVLGGGER